MVKKFILSLVVVLLISSVVLANADQKKGRCDTKRQTYKRECVVQKPKCPPKCEPKVRCDKAYKPCEKCKPCRPCKDCVKKYDCKVYPKKYYRPCSKKDGWWYWIKKYFCKKPCYKYNAAG